MRRPQPYSSSKIRRSRSGKRPLQAIFGDGIDEVVGLLGGRNRGQALRSFGSLHQPRDIRGHAALLGEKLKQRADRRQLAPDGNRAQAAMVEIAQPLADLEHRELGRRGRMLARRREISGELFQVARIVAQRVRRGVLQAQIGEVTVDRCQLASAVRHASTNAAPAQPALCGILPRAGACDRAADFRASAADRR